MSFSDVLRVGFHVVLSKKLSRVCGLIGLILALCGCGTSLMRYEPSSRGMDVDQAISTIEKLTMMQHPAWRPDYLAFEYEYMAWDFGYVTSQRASAVAVPIGNTAVAIGRGRGTTRHLANRIYFSDIRRIELLSWRRKFKQWYVISIVHMRNRRTHVLRTRYLDDAQAYIDAMHVVMHARINRSAQGKPQGD
jgi:hypothetical protein